MNDEKIEHARGSVVHRPVERVLRKLGEDISLARRVRRISTADFARRCGCSRATLHRLESGDPSVGVNTLAMALHVLGRLETLSELADPRHDDVLMMQVRGSTPRRIGKPRRTAESKTETAPEGDAREPSKFVGF